MFKRIDNPVQINIEEVNNLFNIAERVIIQYSCANWTEKNLFSLNVLAKQHGTKLETRFYGFDTEVFDANVVKKLPDVQNLTIDCMHEAVNLHAISDLKFLKYFRFGVFDSQEINILKLLDLETIERLIIGETRKCNIDLEPLAKCSNLTDLTIVGQNKNISVLVSLPKLKVLMLSSIKKNISIDFLNQMQNLDTLYFMLGGRSSLGDLNLPRLKELSVCRVRGLEELNCLQNLIGLTSLQIEDQIRLERVDVSSIPQLEELKIVNCKSLESVDGVAGLSNLFDLRIICTAINHDQFINQAFQKSLKIFGFYTGKAKQDKTISATILANGFFDRHSDYEKHLLEIQ